MLPQDSVPVEVPASPTAESSSSEESAALPEPEPVAVRGVRICENNQDWIGNASVRTMQ